MLANENQSMKSMRFRIKTYRYFKWKFSILKYYHLMELSVLGASLPDRHKQSTKLYLMHLINIILLYKFNNMHLNTLWMNISPAARQKGLSNCVHQKHAFRDNRICSVWMPLKNRILNVTGWKFTVL